MVSPIELCQGEPRRGVASLLLGPETMGLPRSAAAAAGLAMTAIF